MGGKWVKGAFLILLGIIILIYADSFVEDLKNAIEDGTSVAFNSVWDLLKILLWVLVAWLFVDGVLTIALSFSMHKYTMDDVMKRLLRIEKKLGIVEPKPVQKSEEEEVTDERPVSADEDIPPPPPPTRD